MTEGTELRPKKGNVKHVSIFYHRKSMNNLVAGTHFPIQKPFAECLPWARPGIRSEAEADRTTQP